uniref:hypothetical protein n=1 Tax=Paraisaria gracilioides TaxID=2651847 RepID=UPI0023D8825C|nr:hypothetical protein P2Y88_mgp03 [Paraisaria gracilioides]WDE74386.1 hypothetical protein [Paraisaria gracilioides]
MNKGLPDSLKEAFLDIIPKDRPTIFNSLHLNKLALGWLAGFTSAEGSFMIRVLNSPNHKLNKKIQLEFNLSQHVRDEILMRAIANYFQAGSVSINRNASIFRVVNFSELTEIILPIFINYPIQGIKYFDYLYFLRAAEIIKYKKRACVGFAY